MLARSKYKTCDPEETISVVKSILELNGIKTDIKYFTTTGAEHSCRLRIINKGLEPFDIGVNGKGMDMTYATASAYGELMERLQNKALCRENIKYAAKSFSHLDDESNLSPIALNFQYFPDEKLTETKSADLTDTVIPAFFPNHIEEIKACDFDDIDKVVSIFAPFQNLSDGEYTFIPVEWFRAMCGSTGLCAGNSREEALVQGINEICERYVLMRLYLHEYNLPSIPLNIFEGHDIFNRLNALKHKYQIVIKDCSLGMGIPVLGLLLINKTEGKYAFRLGADFNLVTALERCYTESFQGENASNQIFRTFDIKSPSDLREYGHSLKNGTGRFPHYILKETNTEQRFPHIDFANYQEELDYYVSLFGKFGRDIYVKDNSFLGFPAYSIYIPGFSSIDYPLSDLVSIILSKSLEHHRLPLTMDVAKAFSTNPDLLISHAPDLMNLDLQKWNTSKAARVPAPIIKFYCYAMKGDFKSAHNVLKRHIEYIESKMIPVPALLRCAHDVASVLDGSCDMNTIRLIYGDESVDKLLLQIRDVPKYFSSQWFPKCFHCSECKIARDCHFEDVVRFEQALQVAQTQYSGYKL